MLKSLAAECPYYAVFFISLRNKGERGYAARRNRWRIWQGNRKGFWVYTMLGKAPASLFRTGKQPEHVRAWKQHSEHLLAQVLGRSNWYADYLVKVCRVEREYVHPGH